MKFLFLISGFILAIRAVARYLYKNRKDKVFLGVAVIYILTAVLGFTTLNLIEKEARVRESKQEVILHEAKLKFDSDNAYITHYIEENIYEVIIGGKIYDGYFNPKTDEVYFLEKGQFE